MNCNYCGTSLPPEASFCSKCGSALVQYDSPDSFSGEITAAQAKPKRKKSKKMLFLLAGLVLVVGVVLTIIILSSRTEEFKLLADGTLYYAEGFEDLIEIPREFDGKAFALDGKYNDCSIKYDGKLQHFLKFYSWLTDPYYRDKCRYIYCNDYTLLIYPNSGGGVGTEYPESGGVHLIYLHYEVLSGEKRVKCFETYYDLWEWLN